MTTVEKFFEDVISVRWNENKDAVNIIDQTLLPGERKRIDLRTADEIWEAIKKLRVRGAPAIGVCAAYGMALLSSQFKATTKSNEPDHNMNFAIDQLANDTKAKAEFAAFFKQNKDYLATSRPTAVNLFWALDRMEACYNTYSNLSIPEIQQRLFAEAEQIREEDVQISRKIGEIGFSLLQNLKVEGEELGILTHCNAGTLATAKYGTATAPMYIALEKGWPGDAMRVYCDETRPLLQGARLTAFELANAGIKTTLQCDNMASILMQSGKIKIIFVGCDRVAKNGDAANKIGTSGLAILAKHYGVPFYICAPSSTIDLNAKSARDIPIEMRDPDEIDKMWYKESMAPSGIEIFNPAFDVTEHQLITGIITEKGLCKFPYDRAFEDLFG